MPVGGEIFSADFNEGFNLFIEERYTLSYISNVFSETQHSIWLVTDGHLKNEVLSLCKEIRVYRELDVVSDMMLGTPPRLEFLPRIYFDTGSFCYRIELLNWDNHSGGAWVDFPIRQELFNDSVLIIHRIDLSQKPSSDDPYSFARDYFGADSINSEGGCGWYSTLPIEQLAELLSLASNISESNAEIIWSR